MDTNHFDSIVHGEFALFDFNHKVNSVIFTHSDLTRIKVAWNNMKANSLYTIHYNHNIIDHNSSHIVTEWSNTGCTTKIFEGGLSGLSTTVCCETYTFSGKSKVIARFFFSFIDEMLDTPLFWYASSGWKKKYPAKIGPSRLNKQWLFTPSQPIL